MKWNLCQQSNASVTGTMSLFREESFTIVAESELLIESELLEKSSWAKPKIYPTIRLYIIWRPD